MNLDRSAGQGHTSTSARGGVEAVALMGPRVEEPGVNQQSPKKHNDPPSHIP